MIFKKIKINKGITIPKCIDCKSFIPNLSLNSCDIVKYGKCYKNVINNEENNYYSVLECRKEIEKCGIYGSKFSKSQIKNKIYITQITAFSSYLFLYVGTFSCIFILFGNLNYQ